jgi:hypothetical protein
MAATIDQIFLGKSKGALRQTLGEIAHPDYSGTFYPERLSTHIRTPDVITTRRWIAQGEYIKCFINPSDTAWNITRRETFTKTGSGFVRNTWRNKHRDTYFDNYTINFTFQTGNLMPSAANLIDLSSPEKLLLLAKSPGLPPGLDNFYKFLSLIDQTSLNGTGANYHVIVHHTRLFPQVWIEGFFDPQGPNWAESSESGNSARWNCPFMVHRTVPKLSNYQLMRAVYKDWLLNTGAIGEQIPIRQAKALAKDKDFFAKLFGNWGYGDLSESGDPSKVMRSKGEKVFREDPAGIGPGPDTPVGNFNNHKIIGQTQFGTTSGFDPRTKIISQGSVGSLSPFDNSATIGEGSTG